MAGIENKIRNEHIIGIWTPPKKKKNKVGMDLRIRNEYVSGRIHWGENQ